MPANADRTQRAIDALRAPDPSLSRVPNTVRQSIADVIEDLRQDLAELRAAVERAPREHGVAVQSLKPKA